MGLPGFLLGILIAEISAANVKTSLAYFKDRLLGKQIELQVEANGKKLKVLAHSRQELELAINQAINLIDLRTQKFNFGAKYGVGNDRVSAIDQLGFERYVSTFVDLIESPYTKPPLTIGILGSWGMGKSFLLEQIEKQLKQR